MSETIKVADLQAKVRPLEASTKWLEEELMELFNAGEKTLFAEREMERQISAIAQKFLVAKNASTDTDIELIFEKFQKSQIPDFPSEVGNYIDDLTETVIADSIHTFSPRYIGPMTSALPYFVRPIGKLLTAMNQNSVKMETAKTLSPCERQTLAMMHRLIYDFSEEFYNQHIRHLRNSIIF